LTAVSVGANVAFLSDSYKLFWTRASQVTRADLRALEIAGRLNPSYVLTEAFLNIPAGSYLSAVGAWGSPAYTDAELLAQPEGQRAGADKVLGMVLGLKLEPGGAGVGSCRTVSASASGATGIELGPGRITMRAHAGSAAKVALGRFSDQLPIAVGPLLPGSTASLTIPADRSGQPWRLGLVGRGPVAVCRTRAD
jgi:hypothetical protein